MFELIIIIAFLWLSFKAVGLALRLAWGATKIFASILFAIALPTLVMCILFASGVILLVPIILVAVAVGILKSSV